MRGYKLFFIVFLAFLVSVQGQQVTKVLISGLGGDHDAGVKSSFEAGYESYNGTSFSGSIDLYYDASLSAHSSFEYASANGYNVIVRSTTGLSYVVSEAENYPGIQVFMPAGSNTFKKVYSGSVKASPVVITGAGETANETGYSIEFYSIDPITGTDHYSSYSNGYVAGQVCYIANELDISVSEARTISRNTGSNSGVLDQYDGYGQVVVASALSALPVELSSFQCNAANGVVELEWDTATEVNNYGFEIERHKASSEKQDADWETIGFVEGNGTTNTPQSYFFIDEDLPDADSVSYRLKQLDLDGQYGYSKIVTVVIPKVTDVADEDMPTEFSLSQNYPNPFNPTTIIEYSVANAGNVSLKVYDLLGREVMTLVEDVKSAGSYSVEFNGSRLASGIYVYRFRAGNYVATKKMVLVK